ncbi:MAG: PHP domain-containing protein [Eubacteriales bacterium]|nr:PHP domain-containing protein [Eubacteriales bacterium]
MNFLSNAHTHTTYCDGKSTVAEQLATAQALGFVSLGFSSHAMQGFDWKYCMSVEGQQAYLTELRALQNRQAVAGLAPKIYIGIEQDALVPEEQKARNHANFDYIIGSTHYFPEPLQGVWVAVDGDPELLRRCVTERFGGDALSMAEAYYRLHAQAIRQDAPDIIGHFDLVRKYAAVIGLDTGCTAYHETALTALESAYAGCRLLEVNTGGIARGYEQTPFPAGFLLDAWRELGGEVTLTSDCHDARYMDCAFEATATMLKARGFRRLLRLGTGGVLWDEVPL